MILSIDIGIRNLALCIMSAEDKTDMSTFKIHLWDVFDTLESDEHNCVCLQKNGKICNKKCSYKYIDSNKNVNYTCKMHFPKEIKIDKSNIFKKKMINDYLLQDIADIVLTKLQHIYDTNSIFKQLTSIVIELQPKINQKMKFTSHIIYGKLVELMRHTKCTIRFVRASHKLLAYTGPEIFCKLKGAYAKRKWLSIKYSEWFLENRFSKEQKDKWLSFLISHNKQDDLCDTYLMAINSLHGIPKKQRTDKNGRCIK
jgi:hypothetical protein